MGHKGWIATAAAVVLVVGLCGAAYLYDSTQRDKIADGVTIGGVDVGGMTASEERVEVHRDLLSPLNQSLAVNFDGKSWKLSGAQLKVRADINGAVERAVEESQNGGLPTRLVRYVAGSDLDKFIPAQVSYS